MARRDQHTTNHPDVEAAHVDLSLIEGKKATVQTETLGIAENKKRLEQSFEDSKREIEDALAILRRESDIEREGLEKQNVNLKKENTQLEQSNSVLRSENASLTSASERLSGQVTRDTALKDQLSNDIKSLTTSKDILQKEVNELTPQAASLQKRVSILTADIVDLEAKKKSLQNDNESEAAAFATTLKSHGELVVTRDTKQKEDADLDKLIGEKREQLAVATSALSETTAKNAAAKEDRDKQDVSSNERMAAATRLEGHVTEKLQNLKEIEKQFTTEHLARFGYKKTE